MPVIADTPRVMPHRLALLEVILIGKRLRVGDPETGIDYLLNVPVDVPTNFTVTVKFGPTGVTNIRWQSRGG